MNDTVDSSHKLQLARAVVRMLRPLIRLLIRHEVTHTDLNELIRQTYVEVAFNHFSIPNQEMTNSRVAVLTGLSRKEVVRMHDALKNNEELQRQKPNRAQRVVNGWLSDKEFLDKESNPSVLPIRKLKAGKQHGSFMALVKRYSGDITYGAVLEELNHIGVTQQPDEKTVKLVNSAYVPRKDELEQVRVIATSVADLFNTTIHNIDAKDINKRFQRQVVYNDIDEKDVEEFKQLTAETAAPVLQELNAFLSSKRQNKSEETGTKKRIGFGFYYIEGGSDKPTGKSPWDDS